MFKVFMVIFIISFIFFYIQSNVKKYNNKISENSNKLSDYNKYVKMEEINKMHENAMLEMDKMCKECTSKIDKLYNNAKFEINSNYE